MTHPEQSGDAGAHRHRRRLAGLFDRLPGWIRSATHWLLKPESRWARIPAGILLMLGGFLSHPARVRPVDAAVGPHPHRGGRPRACGGGVARVLDWLEERRPHWF